MNEVPLSVASRLMRPTVGPQDLPRTSLGSTSCAGISTSSSAPAAVPIQTLESKDNQRAWLKYSVH